MSTKIILLFSLALDDTYAVFKISFATGPNALGKHTGPDIFHFVVFFLYKFFYLRFQVYWRWCTWPNQLFKILYLQTSVNVYESPKWILCEDVWLSLIFGWFPFNDRAFLHFIGWSKVHWKSYHKKKACRLNSFEWIIKVFLYKYTYLYRVSFGSLKVSAPLEVF